MSDELCLKTEKITLANIELKQIYFVGTFEHTEKSASAEKVLHNETFNIILLLYIS